MNHSGNNIEARLWTTADELGTNSKLKSSEYSAPVDSFFTALFRPLAAIGAESTPQAPRKFWQYSTPQALPKPNETKRSVAPIIL